MPEARREILPKKATFDCPSEEWVLHAASTKESEEREFVVDSGASMHMVSKKDLNSAELETMRTSKSPTTVMTANGEVQTREEATVHVKRLDFVCQKLPQFFPWGNSVRIMGIHTLIRNGKRIDCNISNDGIGTLGRALQAAAKATHSLTCGVQDRESNEIKFLREATELIEAWQHQLLSGQPISGPPSEHVEVILVERQR